MKKALYFQKQEGRKVQCNLCPHNCIISEGKVGICRVRKNINAELYSTNYEKVSAIHDDPIEKKPLYHFFPGRKILSIGGFGCNLRCQFCQNWEISQASDADYENLKSYPAKDIIEIAVREKNNLGIAYTYNEPTVWYEYMLETAMMAKEKGLQNVMVTNGFINKKPLDELMKYMDAFSVDLKGFTEEFYKEVTFSKLEPVKENLKIIKEAGKHLEITNLVIPTLNDDEKKFEQMAIWIAETLGRDTVLHISRYHPMFKMTIKSTPPETLQSLFRIAKKHLHHVFVGNILLGSETEDTTCIKCGHTLIKRAGYLVNSVGIDDKGCCNKCGTRNIIQ